MNVSAIGVSRCGLDLTGGRQKRQTRRTGDNPTVENFRSTKPVQQAALNSRDILEAVSSIPERRVKCRQGGRSRGSFSLWYSRRDEALDCKAANGEHRITKVATIRWDFPQDHADERSAQHWDKIADP